MTVSYFPCRPVSSVVSIHTVAAGYAINISAFRLRVSASVTGNLVAEDIGIDHVSHYGAFTHYGVIHRKGANPLPHHFHA